MSWRDRPSNVAAVLAAVRDEPEVETDRHVRTRFAGACAYCGKATRYIELAYETCLHPDTCTDAYDKAYAEAEVSRGPWRPMSLIDRERYPQ